MTGSKSARPRSRRAGRRGRHGSRSGRPARPASHCSTRRSRSVAAHASRRTPGTCDLVSCSSVATHWCACSLTPHPSDRSRRRMSPSQLGRQLVLVSRKVDHGGGCLVHGDLDVDRPPAHLTAPQTGGNGPRVGQLAVHQQRDLRELHQLRRAAGAGARPRRVPRARRASPRSPHGHGRAAPRRCAAGAPAGCRAGPSAAAARPMLTRPRWHRPGTAVRPAAGAGTARRRSPASARKP